MSDRAAWENHPNIGGPGSMLLAYHDRIRAASARLHSLIDIDGEIDLAGVARAFVPLAYSLHHHHRAEEAMLFPLILKRTGRMPEELLSDHREMTDAIAAVEVSLSRAPSQERAKSAVARLHEILIAHLDVEESVALPILLAMTPDEAWALVHEG